MSLIEMLLALFLTGLVALGGMGVMHNAAIGIERQEAWQKEISETRLLHSVLRRDLFHALPFPAGQKAIAERASGKFIDLSQHSAFAPPPDKGRILIAMHIFTPQAYRRSGESASRHVEYIHAGDRLIRRIYTHAVYFSSIGYTDSYIIGGIKRLELFMSSPLGWRAIRPAPFMRFAGSSNLALLVHIETQDDSYDMAFSLDAPGAS